MKELENIWKIAGRQGRKRDLPARTTDWQALGEIDFRSEINDAAFSNRKIVGKPDRLFLSGCDTEYRGWETFQKLAAARIVKTLNANRAKCLIFMNKLHFTFIRESLMRLYAADNRHALTEHIISGRNPGKLSTPC
ncbi:hypothetical protein [Paraburkholderia bannensis]|uniref:hypothetical protein n=1 Tax=Paraburkholderia bannensis TaxID=765414 RepID=UPI0012EB8622|nr:hypothetical protein [Paraburkholderia bannensis]